MKNLNFVIHQQCRVLGREKTVINHQFSKQIVWKISVLWYISNSEYFVEKMLNFVINHQFEKSQSVIHHQFRVHGRDYLLTELVIYNSFFSTKHSELSSDVSQNWDFSNWWFITGISKWEENVSMSLEIIVKMAG